VITLKVRTPTGLVVIPPEELKNMPQATWADVAEIWEGNSSVGFTVYPGPASKWLQEGEE